MNNQCVPSWDLDDPGVVAGGGGGLNHHQVSTTTAGAHRGLQVSTGAAGGALTPVVVSMSDQYYEVAELTWEKGNISSHGLGLLNRPVHKQYPPGAPPPSQQMQAIGGVGGGGSSGDRETLEAVVGETGARSHFLSQSQPAQHPAAPWVGVVGGTDADAVARAAADALVPCTAARVDEAAAEGGDAGGASRRKRARVVGEDGGGLVCASQGSTAAAPGRRGGESALLTLDYACGTGADDVCGFTTTTTNSTSLERDDKSSPDTENTSIGGGASDSRCFSRRSQRDGLCDEGENVVINGDDVAIRSSISTKRSRAAAIHNESERKRRDRINQKMKTLQKLVPNSNKTDKASMLDEVIDYLKQLQAQVQVMSRMSSMMMPMGMAMPQLQMSAVMAQMAQMARMVQMAQGMINMGSLAQPGYAGLTPPMMHPPAPFVPMSWADPAAAAATTATSSAAAATGPATTASLAQQPGGGAVPDAFSAFLACQAQQNSQQQPGSMEAYNRMVALYQKMNQLQQSEPSNPSKQ